MNGGFLQVNITANGATQDQLSVLNQGTGPGQIGVSGSTISYGGTAIGTVDATLDGLNGHSLRINLNSNASPAAPKPEIAPRQRLTRLNSVANIAK